MSRCEVRTDTDGRLFLNLDGSNGDRYRHLDSHKQCYTSLKQNKNTRQQKQERYCVFISLMISIASITSSGFLFYFYSSRSVKLADDFCVPCDTVEFNSGKYKMLEKDYENDVEVCCASTPQSTAALLDLISERKLAEFKEEEKNAQKRYGYFKGSQISAHILLDISDTERGKESQVKLLNLTEHPNLNHKNGVNITKDRIVILAKGKYFVYSQMYFKVILGTKQHKHEDVLSFNVKRTNTNLPNSRTQDLLDSKSTVSLKANQIDHDFSTKYMSGIFELEAYDELYVHVVVSSTAFIPTKPRHNFIGLFLLG